MLEVSSRLFSRTSSSISSSIAAVVAELAEAAMWRLERKARPQPSAVFLNPHTQNSQNP